MDTVRESDAGFAASAGGGDVGNTSVMDQFEHGRLPYFVEQFRDGETHDYLHAVGHLSSSRIKVTTRGVADVKFRETLGATAYEGGRVSGAAYAGKDNIDSFWRVPVGRGQH